MDVLVDSRVAVFEVFLERDQVVVLNLGEHVAHDGGFGDGRAGRALDSFVDVVRVFACHVAAHSAHERGEVKARFGDGKRVAGKRLFLGVSDVVVHAV